MSSTHGNPGRGAGRGGAGGGRGYPRKNKKRDIMDGLLPDPLQTIPKPQDISGEPNAEISDVQYLASYNWIEAKTPTIVVPGSPRIWSPPKLPVQIQPDRGKTFIDQNGDRLGANALAPTFEATDALDTILGRTPIQWGSLDIITSRNTFLKLIAWADPQCGRKREVFRIDVELTGSQTIMFRGWEESTSTFNPKAFGDSFERATSRAVSGCEEGTLAGHHRIITYSFAGLKVLLCCEVDACKESDQPSIGSLADQMALLNVASPSPGAQLEGSQFVRILHGGSEVPQTSLLKIKSRSQRKKGHFLESAYLQLYFGQTPALAVGIHNGDGLFMNIKELGLDSKDLNEQKGKAQPGLKKLARLLREVRAAVMDRGQGAKLSLVYKDGELRLMQRTGGDLFLPPSLLLRFAN